MNKNEDNDLSPTVSRVLDEFVAALLNDVEINNEAANQLDDLLREGNVPKTDDIDSALSLATKSGDS